MAKRIRDNHGFVSLLVLLVLSFLTFKGIQAYIKISSGQRIAVYQGYTLQACNLADSGFDLAIASLSVQPEWDGGNFSLDSGEIIVEVREDDSGYKIYTLANVGDSVQRRYGELSQDQDGRLFLTHYEELYGE